MGYYTYFNLSVADSIENAKLGIDTVPSEVQREMAKTLYTEVLDWYSDEYKNKIIKDLDYEMDPLNYEFCGDSIKWYDHDDDMLELSRRYPNYYFILDGSGEERGDDWIAYYHNGKHQLCRAQITYDAPSTLYLD